MASGLTRSLSITIKLEKPPLWPMPFLQQFYVICRTYSLTRTHIKHIGNQQQLIITIDNIDN